MAHNRPKLPLRALMAVLSLAAAAPAGKDGILARPPAVEANPGKRKHRPPARLRGLLARLIDWAEMRRRGWTRDGRGDLRNPERERRRIVAAQYARQGRRLTGRQWKRVRRGDLAVLLEG